MTAYWDNKAEKSTRQRIVIFPLRLRVEVKKKLPDDEGGYKL